MKTHQMPDLQQKTISEFKGRLWQQPGGSKPEPVTTSGMICTVLVNR